MGGILSGRRGWRGGKQSTDSLPVVRLTHADTSTLMPRSTYLRIDGHDHGTVIHGLREWPVWIAMTSLHFGGVRRWLVCPCCQSRRHALYIAKAALACRGCLRLRYGVQHENQRARLIRRADRIRARLGWKSGPLNPDGRKPPGMHWATYFRLREELDALTDALVGNVSKWIDRTEVMLDKRWQGNAEVLEVL